MPDSLPAAPGDDPRRPVAVLAVYSWDLVLAIVALFGALAPFAGGLAVGSRRVTLPLAAQVVFAVASASYAATLLIVASLLTRRRRWIRRMQIVTLAATIAFATLSVLVDAVDGTGIDGLALLGVLAFVLLDGLCILIMTERRVGAFYTEPAPAPVYVLGTFGIWAAGSCAIVALGAVLR